jgi:hypothetical protein
MARDYMRSVRPIVERLSAPADVQLASTPSYTTFADDVIEDAELILLTGAGEWGTGLTEEEKRLCLELWNLIEQIVDSEPAESEFWLHDAVVTHAKWQAIRDAAARALRRFHVPDPR